MDLVEGKNNRYKPIAKYILYHQMFTEPNLIRDRKNLLSVPIKGSGNIIHKMLNVLLADIKLWDEGKEVAYIRKLTENVGVEFEDIEEKYQTRLTFLNKEQLKDKPAKLMLVYCDLLTLMLNKIKDKVLNNLYEKVKGAISKEQFYELITELPDEEDAQFNILLNLAILKDFARIVKLNKIEISNEKFLTSITNYIKRNAS